MRRKSQRIRKFAAQAETVKAPPMGHNSSESPTSLERIYGKQGVPVFDPVEGLKRLLNHEPELPIPAKDYKLTKGEPVPVPNSQTQTKKPTTALTVVEEPEKAGVRRVTVLRDHTLEYPELYLDVFINGPSWEERLFTPMFARSMCRRASSPDNADLVVFTGGADVNPALYGEEPHPKTKWDDDRDNADLAMYWQCYESGIPMLGVCRGAQFLSVMHGGKLIQHLDNHNGEHKIYDTINKVSIDKVSSVHHQAVKSNRDGGMEILAFCGVSNERHFNNKLSEVGKKMDIEAFWYRETCSIGIQGHPEYSGYNYFTKWSLDLLNSYVVCNPDIEWLERDKGKPVRRLKKSILDERRALIQQKVVN